MLSRKVRIAYIRKPSSRADVDVRASRFFEQGTQGVELPVWGFGDGQQPVERIEAAEVAVGRLHGRAEAVLDHLLPEKNRRADQGRAD